MVRRAVQINGASAGPVGGLRASSLVALVMMQEPENKKPRCREFLLSGSPNYMIYEL